MPSVLAIVSKAIFERDAKLGGRIAGVGDVVPLERYTSKNKALAPVADNGALFLVTVRPPDENLWLVGVLESPTFDGEHWTAAKNTVPIADISTLKDQIKFVTGAGISAKKGALGMSLQTPRILSDADVALLRAVAGGAPMTASGAKGHFNAHEKSGALPCLCRKCIEQAPETVTAGGLVFLRDRAEAKGRFLWYWVPEGLKEDRDAIRRAVESRLHARVHIGTKRKYDDLDEAFTGDADNDEDEDEDDE
jgi:hypothetical protein